MAHPRGKIVIEEGATVACAIVAKTDTTAKLKLPIGVAVPDRFELIELSSGESFEVKVTSKRYPDVFVSFQARVYV